MSTKHLTQALRRIVDWDELSAKDRMDYGSNGERDYYRNLAREALATYEALEAVPAATYMGHRLTPAETKEFWGWAMDVSPEGTKFYVHPAPQPQQAAKEQKP